MLDVLRPKNMIYIHWPCSICISYIFVVVTNKSDTFDFSKKRFIWLTALVHHGREDLGACMTAQSWCQGIRCLLLIRSRAEIVTKPGLQWPIPSDLLSAVGPCLLRFYSPKQELLDKGPTSSNTCLRGWTPHSNYNSVSILSFFP